MSNFINSDQYLELMLTSKHKHVKIISIFAKLKEYSFDNYEQIQRFIKRNTRAAKELDCYDLDKIERVAKYLDKTANFKWTLETILKYIDEDIDKLSGEDPIIILRDGKKIYDVKQLREYEQSNRIKWDGRKWVEL